MKVLFYNHTGQVSGAERSLLSILGHVDRSEFELKVACPADGELMPSVRKMDLECFSIQRLEARFTRNPGLFARYAASFLNVRRELRQVIAKFQPDIIHSNSVRAGIVANLATSGSDLPVVWHIRDLMPTHVISSALRRYAYSSKHTYLLAIANAVAEAFQGKSKKSKSIEVIHNGIEVHKFRAESGVRSRMRGELQVDGGQFVVGIVGQVTPWKGQLELIRAFRQVAKEIPHAVLMIVGAPLFNKDEEYMRELVAEAESPGLAGRVRFLGQRQDAGSVMQAFDLLVLNSWAEPFGRVIVEGMSCGLPVIATNAGGVPEIISHGKSGWLVPPKDEKALAASIIKLFADGELRKRIGDQGITEAEQRFSMVAYAKKLQEFHRRVSNDARSGAGTARRRNTTEASA